VQALFQRLRELGLEPRADVPLASLGYWRVGGPADLFLVVEDSDQLAAVLGAAADVPVTVLGNGSNLLVSDRGIRGLTLRLGGRFKDSDTGTDGDGPWVEAGAGLMNTVLLARLARLGWGGLAALAGVPGTIGGAIRMNAGTHLGEIGERVLHVDVVLTDGGSRRLEPSDLGFAYRWAQLPSGAIVTGARLRALDDPEAVTAEREAVRSHLARRRATQPLDKPSCGSVFRNPTGDAAGRLIEVAGLKGCRRGGAMISDVHANFIINTGDATAEDVRWLVQHARDTVYTTAGIRLEPEVHAVGDWGDDWPLPSIGD
jgi:UDP-N-acetylmuramate dehydrogenase